MRLFLFLLVLVIAGIVGGQQYLVRNPQRIEYMTESVRAGDITEAVAVTGYAEPIEIHVVQAELMGVVEEVLVDFNDEVRQGQTLARLATDVQELELTQAEQQLITAESQVLAADAGVEAAKAALSAAESGLQAAETELTFAEKRLADMLIPRDRVDALRSMRDQAAANVDAAHSKVKQAQTAKQQAISQVKSSQVAIRAAKLSLEKSELRSSMNGIVLNKDIRVGDTVGRPRMSLTSTALGLFEIAAPLDRMRAIVKVSEADYSRVKVGQKATFTVDAYPEEEFEAEVVQIRHAPTSDRTAVSYDTVLTFENRRDPDSNEWMVKPRSTISADIQIRQAENVAVIPNSALLFAPNTFSGALPSVGDGESIVWKLGADGEPAPVVVRTGITDGFRTQVLDDSLKDGDSLITGEPANVSAKLRIPISL